MDGCIFCLFWIYITFQVLSLLSLNFFVIHRHLEQSLLDISLFLSRRPSLLLFLSHSLLSGHIISISILFSCPSNYSISAPHNVKPSVIFFGFQYWDEGRAVVLPNSTAACPIRFQSVNELDGNWKLHGSVLIGYIDPGTDMDKSRRFAERDIQICRCCYLCWGVYVYQQLQVHEMGERRSESVV